MSNIYNAHRNDAEGFAFNGAARRYAFGGIHRVDSRVPVEVVPGSQAPELTGERGGHFTYGGEPITYPSAYSKRGWSNMVYRTDTRVVIVGRDWVPPAKNSRERYYLGFGECLDAAHPERLDRP